MLDSFYSKDFPLKVSVVTIAIEKVFSYVQIVLLLHAAPESGHTFSLTHDPREQGSPLIFTFVFKGLKDFRGHQKCVEGREGVSNYVRFSPFHDFPHLDLALTDATFSRIV